MTTELGWRDLKYTDSTPELHVGSSAFEDWFQKQPFACQVGIKQIARDAYAAGMGDPLVTGKAAADKEIARLAEMITTLYENDARADL